MDWIESGGKVKIRVVIRDIFFFNSLFFLNSIKIPPQTLNPPLTHIKMHLRHSCSHLWFGFPLWRGVLKSVEGFLTGIKVDVGFGNETRFWLDHWIGNQCLATVFHNLFVVAPNPKASMASQTCSVDGIKECHIDFRRWFPPSLLPNILHLLSTINSHAWQAREDRRCWKLSWMEFSSWSLFTAPVSSDQDIPAFTLIRLAPSAQNLHPCMARLSKLASYWGQHGGERWVWFTRDNMAGRGWCDSLDCVLCNSGIEMAEHIFISCLYTQHIWSLILTWLNLSSLPLSIEVL